jgi:hypothetical protein
MVFESDKFILFKSGMFVEKRYLCNDLFKINVMIIVTNDKNNNKIVSSSYLFETYYVWHDKLGHVNYNFMQRLINHGLLPSMIFYKNHKCDFFVELKFTKSSFQIIKRSNEPLDLIHSNIDDLKFMQTRDWKRYYITFIDDCTRYYYTYLQRRKDKAL